MPPQDRPSERLIDWSQVGRSPQPSGRPRRRRPRPPLAAALVALLVAAPFGVAATGDALREGVRNGTTARETEIIGSIRASQAAKGGYVTRQSNVATGATAGGAAIYGCRGAAGGTAAGSAPCLRASNLAGGRAFEFASTAGPAGLFQAGDPASPPFQVSGTGLVTGLNADRVDGFEASELRGAPGPAGPQGPAGPTGASPVVDQHNNSAVPFLNLNAAADYEDVYTPPFEIERPGFVYVAAHLELDADGGDNDAVQCRIVRRQGASSAFSGYMRTDVADTSADVTTLSTSALLNVEPGDYEIGVQCDLISGAIQVQRVVLPMMVFET